MREDVSSPCTGRRNVVSPRSPRGEKKRLFLLLAIVEDSSCEAPRSPRARIGIGRVVSNLQVLSFLLPLLLSPLADTARNWSTTVKIDRDCPTEAVDGRNRSLPLDIDQRWSKSIVTDLVYADTSLSVANSAFVDVSPEELVKNDPSDLKESTKATPAETQLVSTWHVTD
ncbi:hypothetical protein B296_00014855 [Ensete ventricosum]|uniref:Uncharacterized protein n=1 Tax=Ensete ventricosum TaxID=4639 RepID=A0A427B7C1_ENSVE|nr:hypothetical protein B296_00014855 [Ensete ventricosum]